MMTGTIRTSRVDTGFGFIKDAGLWRPAVDEPDYGRHRNIRYCLPAYLVSRAPDDIVEDALAGYLEELAAVRKTLDSRYDDLESGRVKLVDGEEAFRTLREKSERRRSGG
jgi:hypothetical protein